MQDLPVILKWHNFQSLEKALNFFMELKKFKSDVYFLNRCHKCVCGHFGSEYTVYTDQLLTLFSNFFHGDSLKLVAQIMVTFMAINLTYKSQ